MSYSVKFASAYYGPFREAADSAPGKGDRKSYQMDFRNGRESVREALLDEAEGADMLMVKPALAYLDVIRSVRESSRLPLACYNVSAEYSNGQSGCQSRIYRRTADCCRKYARIRPSRGGCDHFLSYPGPVRKGLDVTPVMWQVWLFRDL